MFLDRRQPLTTNICSSYKCLHCYCYHNLFYYYYCYYLPVCLILTRLTFSFNISILFILRLFDNAGISYYFNAKNTFLLYMLDSMLALRFLIVFFLPLKSEHEVKSQKPFHPLLSFSHSEVRR